VLNVRSLRFRLALWYFCSVAAIFALAAGGYWFGVRGALNHALDQGLRYRLIGLQRFLENIDAAGNEGIAEELNETSQLAELYQILDANGNLIAESGSLAHHHVPVKPPRELGYEIRYVTGGTGDFELRLAWQKVTVHGRTLILGVADPQRKYEGILRAFTSVLLLSTVFILSAATLCGVWLGRRALRPVARITDGARAITESNLSARLAVPDSRDELQQLSETLNDMLARIEQSFARTRQFTADASHELRAPITLIDTAAQYSLRRERSREELVDSMRKILRESRRMTALIDDLLLLARGDSHRAAPDLELMDAAPLLSELAEQAAARAAEKNIRIALQLGNGALPVMANEMKLRRLLLILLDNAFKFTPPGGEVTLAGRLDEAEVVIRVTDTGSGISPADLPHIFERFWRADKVRSREAGGTGLGLAIAKQIADQHGAQLDVQSTVGRGSTFTVRLPQAAG